jgi:hypothetical protein
VWNYLIQIKGLYLAGTYVKIWETHGVEPVLWNKNLEICLRYAMNNPFLSPYGFKKLEINI